MDDDDDVGGDCDVVDDVGAAAIRKTSSRGALSSSSVTTVGGVGVTSSSSPWEGFLSSLDTPPAQRSKLDIDTLYFTLRSFACLGSLGDEYLYRLSAQNCFYLRKSANDILYCRGEVAHSWFILVSGSVFIDGSMFLPITSFGRRQQSHHHTHSSSSSHHHQENGGGYNRSSSGGSAPVTRRPNECLILEPSEMIVIDYDESSSASRHQQNHTHHQMVFRQSTTTTSSSTTSSSHRNSIDETLSDDTSSAYSGSDTMLSSSTSQRHNHSYHGNTAGGGGAPTGMGSSSEIDLSGLIESVVDEDDSVSSFNDNNSDIDDDSGDSGDEDDGAEVRSQCSVRDSVRECLEKDPSERSDFDVSVLLDFTRHLAAFHDLTLNVRKALCQKMVFAVVEKAGTVVMSDGEELDSWSVLVNGAVEIVTPMGEVRVLSAGDSFGLPPTLDKQYFAGLMRTRVDDCQFLCVTQTDYFHILKTSLESQRTIRCSRTNEPLLVYESRGVVPGSSVESPAGPLTGPGGGGWIVIRGSREGLIGELLRQENSATDPTFVEDFLLTQRIFMDPAVLAERIIEAFGDCAIRDKVTRVMLLWVNNHFIDFEVNNILMQRLLTFQCMLESSKDCGNKSGQLRLLQIACSTKSRPRTVVLSRVSREDPLPFNIMGGVDNGYGVFVSSVVEDGQKESSSGSSSSLGIRVGDEILSVNNVNFRNISLAKAFDTLTASTHLVLVLKCNFLGHHECITSTVPLHRNNHNHHHQVVVNPPPPAVPASSSSVTSSSTSGHHGHSSGSSRLRKTLQRMIPKRMMLTTTTSHSGEATGGGGDKYGGDGVDGGVGGVTINFPENVLKIYRPDQSFKFFLVNKETSAREVVMLACKEWQDAGTSRDYALFQVSVAGVGETLMLKQTRLPDGLDSLAERLGLGSRYYVKRAEASDPLVPNELLPEIHKESQVSLLNLNPTELALQLTLEDYACFRQIEQTEFIDELFNLSGPYGTPNLSQFSQLVNRETFWVVTEVVREQTSVAKRVNVIKRFLKVAVQCRECRNFNSMFAIVSGLGHSSVSRLKNTWDKVGNKYNRVFKELTDLMDPSRNMSRYRALLTSSRQTPMIPFYPVVKKDLTFIDLGNSTYIDDGLINFEKMRMVSKEIRNLIQMSSGSFDTRDMTSFAAMNQLTSNKLTTTTGKGSSGGGSGSGHKSGGGGSGRSKRRDGAVTTTLSPSKMYKEMNMIRKVKAYLGRLKIVSDEAVLHEMSLKCEGSATATTAASHKTTTSSVAPSAVVGGTLKRGNNNQQQQMAPPSSPTLSTTSSQASGGESRGVNSNNNAAGGGVGVGKFFGTGSPHSYQKLLSLSEPSSSGPVGGGSSSSSSNKKKPSSSTTAGHHHHHQSSTTMPPPPPHQPMSNHHLVTRHPHQHQHPSSMSSSMMTSSHQHQHQLYLSTESSSVLPATNKPHPPPPS